MKLVLLVLACLVLSTGMSLGDKKVKGSGYLLVEARPAVTTFKKISVQQGITFFLGQGNSGEITVEADNNIISYIKTEIRGDELNVYIEPGIQIRRYTAMNVSVSVPEVTSIALSSASRLEGAGAIRVSKLDIFLSGASTLKMEVRGDSLHVEASGASRLQLKGNVKNLVLDLSSGAYLKAWTLFADTCEANVSGSSKGEIYVRHVLRADVNTSGLLIYDGNPSSVIPHLNSGGVVVKKK